MIEIAIVLTRLLQYVGAAILFGSSLFFIYALPASRPPLPWLRPLLVGSALLLVTATLAGLLAQTAARAGGWSESVKSEALTAVVTQMDLGKAAIARASLGVIALALLVTCRPSRGLWVTAALVGGIATVTFAWMGHGAATEGDGHFLHLVADTVHSLAAALWIGALCGFLVLMSGRSTDRHAVLDLHDALKQFSSVGTVLVIALIGTGMINSWFLVGLDFRVAISTPYGQMLALKLLLFGGMLVLAMVHRFRLVPALSRQVEDRIVHEAATMSTLRRTVSIEAALGFGIMAVVAWMGTLAPPALQ